MQKKESYLFASLFFLIATALLHFIAIFFHLYWELPWFNTIVHTCGGISASLFALWISLSFRNGSFSFSRILFVCGVTFGIGIIWELFQLHFGITMLTSSIYVFDTSKDLIMDIAGAFITCAYVGFYKRDFEQKNFSA